MSINIAQLRVHVIRPALEFIQLHSEAAENLVVGTALVESEGSFIKQVGAGPALGLFQMEPATDEDIWDHFLAYKRELARRVNLLQTIREDDFHEELMGNLFYAAAMCRVHYRRVSEALPAKDDAPSMAQYWKVHYNTLAGAGTTKKALPFFRRACG